MAQQRKYGEGSVVAIPLDSGQWGLAVISRCNTRGHLVLYFYDNPVGTLPAPGSLKDLVPTAAKAVAQVGALGIHKGRWMVVSRVEPWDRDAWRTTFIRYEQLTGKSYQVEYDDHDPSKLIAEREVPSGAAEQAPSDALMGYRYAEEFLSRLLS